MRAQYMRARVAITGTLAKAADRQSHQRSWNQCLPSLRGDHPHPALVLHPPPEGMGPPHQVATRISCKDFPTN